MAQMGSKQDQETYDPQDDGQPHNTTKRYAHINEGQQAAPQKRGNVDIHDPMLLWIIFLLSAVALRILTSSTTYVPFGTQIYNIAILYSNFLLTIPGIAIFPLIAGAIIGSEVGERSNSLESAMRSGLINGIYASIIYVIAIVIIYIILNYFTTPLSTVYVVVLNNVIFPILVFLLLLETFAALAYWRKVDT